MSSKEYYSGLRLHFSETLRNWAAQSSAQLRDSFQLQKIWNGRRSNSVWEGKTRSYYYKGGPNQLKEKRNRVQVSSWSWYDEVKLRIMKDTYSRKKNYWYSTGLSYQIAQHNPVTIINPSIENGVVDFHSTMGMLYAEAGVGLTGQHHTRGARSSKGRQRIKVNRAADYRHDQKYVSQWTPMQGETHRPSIKQQMRLFARRLRWASQKVYQHDLVTYLGFAIENGMKHLDGMRLWVTQNGQTFGYTFGVKDNEVMARSRISFEQYMEQSGNK